MMHKAWCSIEEVPYCFPRPSIKFQGHKGQKIDDLDQIWARLLGRSQLSNPSDLPCCPWFGKRDMGNIFAPWKFLLVTMCYQFAIICFFGFLWSDSIMNGLHESSDQVLWKQKLQGIVGKVSCGGWFVIWLSCAIVKRYYYWNHSG